MTEYENQLATLRMEVKRLQNYECHSKEISFQDLQTEVVKCFQKMRAIELIIT